jgi:hypothetical protein
MLNPMRKLAATMARTPANTGAAFALVKRPPAEREADPWSTGTFIPLKFYIGLL